MNERIFLRDVDAYEGDSPRGQAIQRLRAAGQPVPQLWQLFAFKTDRTDFLGRFTQGVMRGPSPLAPGLRELIAAFTSKQNHCPY
jgi:hypothetical protein